MICNINKTLFSIKKWYQTVPSRSVLTDRTDYLTQVWLPILLITRDLIYNCNHEVIPSWIKGPKLPQLHNIIPTMVFHSSMKSNTSNTKILPFIINQIEYKERISITSLPDSIYDDKKSKNSVTSFSPHFLCFKNSRLCDSIFLKSYKNH